MSREEFDILFIKNYSLIRGVILSKYKEEDLINETYIHLCNNIHKINSKGSFTQLVIISARNILISRIRRSKLDIKDLHEEILFNQLEDKSNEYFDLLGVILDKKDYDFCIDYYDSIKKDRLSRCKMHRIKIKSLRIFEENKDNIFS